VFAGLFRNQPQVLAAGGAAVLQGATADGVLILRVAEVAPVKRAGAARFGGKERAGGRAPRWRRCWNWCWRPASGYALARV
jgi:hypothetical protein